MKELCENIFCFWRKWFKKNDKSFVSIGTSKLINDEKREDYSSISPKQQIGNTTFIQNKPDIEMSTALPLTEDIVFPLKYLNEIETNPNFHFEFTREKIISYIEELIKNNRAFKSLVNKIIQII